MIARGFLGNQRAGLRVATRALWRGLSGAGTSTCGAALLVVPGTEVNLQNCRLCRLLEAPGIAVRVDAALHAGVEVLLEQLDADLLPARASGRVSSVLRGVARRQSPVRIIERVDRVDMLHVRLAGREQRPPPGRRLLCAFTRADARLD